MADHEQLLTLASDIVSAHVSNNAVTPDQLPLRPIPGEAR
jgi:predicted transcriptional regulator